MKNVFIMATTYPYTAGVLAVMWVGSAMLLKIDSGLSFNTVIVSNVITTLIVANIGFRK
jgi:hypothetical protein